MNNNKRTTLLVAVLTCLAGILIELNTNQARATQLQFSFTDPVGDGDAAVDLVKMDMKIDTATGAFQIDLYADQSKPFFGGFRINVNLYNPDAHSTDPTAQLFNDDLNDFTLTQAETKLTLSGQDVRLVPWAAGDRVAASGPFPLGLPSACLCTAFGSGVLDWPITDFFRQDRIGEGEYTTIALASQPLSLSCPPTTSFKSCNPKAIIPLVYSAIPATISLAQLQAEGGDASASCGIASITYQDSTSGSCPHLLVTRMFTLTDLCGQVTTCPQTISLNYPPGPLPDLTVVNATYTAFPNPGPGPIFRWEFFPAAFVANIGTASAKNIAVAFDGYSPSGAATIPSLDPGQSVWVSPNRDSSGHGASLQPGNFTLHVIVDSNTRITESNETNNKFDVIVNLPSQ